MTVQYAQVLVDRPARSLDRAFSYAVPEALRERVQVGSYVLVPFGQQALPGFVVGFATTPPPGVRVKDLYGLLLDTPLFDDNLMALAEWTAAQYAATVADALRLLLPPGSTRQVRRLVALTPSGSQPGLLMHLQRAPRQQAVLRKLQQEGPALDFDRLLALLREGDPKLTASSLEGALSALVERSFVTTRRELQRPAVQAVERQIATLLERSEPWDETLEELQEKAPRQAEVLATLLATQDGAAALAELNRPAAQALARKGLLTISTEAVDREPEMNDWHGAEVDFLRLNEAQRVVFDRAAAAIEARTNCEMLLHGVTGSGKTEVYLHCVAHALSRGRSAIVLVPEIALTPQMVGRFKARFGAQLALLHSALSQGERFDEWHRIQRGEARIVIGARSALFAPVRDLGLIVVDEEHEAAYKQEQPPRYHAVAVARQRALLEQAVLLLGSATPAVERYYEGLATTGPLQLVALPARVDDRPMPEVRLLDLRGEVRGNRETLFSQELLEAMSQRFTAHEQVMLFLNRRGFSTFIMCRECGFVLRCPDCDISLTYHHQSHSTRCHHCDYAHHVPEKCPNCQGLDIGFHGLGTERVADQLQREFPEIVVARMDRDTIGHKGAHGRILSAFASGEADVLVGTQMIAKGHDFARVTLVGVLNADTGLHRPDFRAAEATFQVLTQVAGRAGRAERPGEVLVQTYNPDHYAVLTASRHDYRAFYERELAARAQTLYPPFVRLARLVFSAEEDRVALTTGKLFAELLTEMGVTEKEGETHFLGPAECPLHKLRGKYRYSILVKSQGQDLPLILTAALARFQPPNGGAVTVDLDPMEMM